MHPKLDFIEIGPGNGAITDKITPLCQSICLIEIDNDLVDMLNDKFSNLAKVSIISCDVLKVDFNELNIHKPYRIIGNLPYNISTPCLFHCIKYISSIS